MDKAEPSLMPEWLWNSGNSGSGGSRSRPITSHLPSDDHYGVKNSRRKISGSNNERNGEHLSVPGRSSSNFHRSASAKHSRSHGSSSRNSRVREWDDRHSFRDNKTLIGKNRYFECDDDLAGVLPLQSNKDVRHPFKSMSFRKSDATLPRKVSGDWNDGSDSIQINSSALSLPGGKMTSTTLGKDFPSLRPEKGQVSCELRRTPSPGLAASPTSVQSSTSSMIAPEVRTSSLAEVPASTGNNSTGNLSSPLSVSAGSAPFLQRLNGLNMAEAVAQSPIRANTPQLSVDTQRREELAFKQSKQLIPVTPTMPKPSSLSSLDKSKSRAMQQSTFSRFDAPKSDASKLQVLKSSRELNGIVSSIPKEKGSPKNGLTSPLSQALAGSSATPNRKNIPVNGHAMAAPDRRAVTPPMGILEKRLSHFQSQSRKDFLNLIKRQFSVASITAGTASSNSTVEKCETPLEAGVASEAASAVVWENKQGLCGLSLPVDTENSSKVTENGEGLESGNKMAENGECIENGGNRPTENGECWIGPDGLEYVPPFDEEEAAFLRSMDWDEFSQEGPLTEEEIRSFYKRHKIDPLRKYSASGAVSGRYEQNFCRRETEVESLS